MGISTVFQLPDNRFGVTATRFNVGEMPVGLPHREVLAAANRLNEHRYKKLTAKQRCFVTEYLANGFDGTAAALNTPGVVPDTKVTDEDRRKHAASWATRLLSKPYIKQAVDLALQYHAEKHQIRIEDLIEELKCIATVSMDDFWVNDGHGDPRLQMPENGSPALRAVSEITVDSYMEGKGDNQREVKRVKFKLHDKMSAIDKLLKIAQSGSDGKINAQAASRAEPEKDGASVQVLNFTVVPRGEYLPDPNQKTIDADYGVEPAAQVVEEGATPFLYDAGRTKQLVEGITEDSVFGAPKVVEES